jgi:hypothetical protein
MFSGIAYSLGYMTDEEAVEITEALVLDGAVCASVDMPRLESYIYLFGRVGRTEGRRVPNPGELER